MILLNRWTLASLLVILAAITYGVTQNGGQENVASNDISLTDSPEPVPQDLEDSYESLIGQAQAQAKNDQFKQAILNLEGVPKNSQHFALAQQVKDEFSQSLLRRANDKYQKGDIQTALTMLDAVAPSSTSSAQAKKLQKDWGEQGEQFEMARTAIAKKDWSNALKSLDQLKGTPIFQSAQVQQLLQLANDQLGQPDKITTKTAVARMPASTDSVVTAQVSTEPATVGSEIDNALAVDVKSAAIAAPEPKQMPVSSIATPLSAPVKVIATAPKPVSEDPVSQPQETVVNSNADVGSSVIQERMAAFDQLKESLLQEETTPVAVQKSTVMMVFHPFESLEDSGLNNSQRLGSGVTMRDFTEPLLNNLPWDSHILNNSVKVIVLNNELTRVPTNSTAMPPSWQYVDY